MTGRVLSMTPEEFAFTLTVPRDVRVVPIVRDVATHVATYAAMDAAHGRAFVDQVAKATERAFTHGHHGAPCELRFTCERGEVRVTLAGETVRQALAS